MKTVQNADHVIDGVYIGSASAIYSVNELHEAGVNAVLKLYFNLPDWPEGFEVCDNAVTDGEYIPPEVLQRGVDFIKAQVEAGKPVLVVCAHGISRSSTFVLAYLLERGYKLPDAFYLLSKQHTYTNPDPELWYSLIMNYNLDYSMDDVWSWYKVRNEQAQTQAGNGSASQ